MHANGRSDGVGLRIDHGDGTAAGIHHIHFIPARVHRQPGRAGADRDHAVLAHVHQVEHGYGIAAAIADVGVLAIIRRIVGEITLLATGRAQRDQDQPWQAAAGMAAPVVYTLAAGAGSATVIPRGKDR